MPNPTTIMLAPTGARLTQKDHPALPMSIAETLDAARASRDVGAHALHAHVRDNKGGHILDKNLYRELLSTAAYKLGSDYPIQITTEAVGMYNAAEQIALIEQVEPRFCSVALRELLPHGHTPVEQAKTRDFYHWAFDRRIGVQHILYGADDIHFYLEQVKAGVIPAEQRSVLIVLGRYGTVQLAKINDVAPAADLANEHGLLWMLCAFGKTETQCLVQAAALGGGVRIGFENSRENTDGSIAADNTERVLELTKTLREKHIELAAPDQVLRQLGAY